MGGELAAMLNRRPRSSTHLRRGFMVHCCISHGGHSLWNTVALLVAPRVSGLTKRPHYCGRRQYAMPGVIARRCWASSRESPDRSPAPGQFGSGYVWALLFVFCLVFVKNDKTRCCIQSPSGDVDTALLSHGWLPAFTSRFPKLLRLKIFKQI